MFLRKKLKMADDIDVDNMLEDFLEAPESKLDIKEKVSTCEKYVLLLEWTDLIVLF